MKKLTKHQRELLKKFGVFRKRQKAKRAEAADIRDTLETALDRFIEFREELSPFQLLMEQRRIQKLIDRKIKKKIA